MNIAQNLERAARFFGDRTAVFFEGRQYTYNDLEMMAGRLAHALTERGVQAADRVALFLPNIPEFIIAYMAVQKVGAIAVALNSMLKAEEARYILADSGSVAVFTTADLWPEIAAARAQLPELLHTVICEGEVAGQPTLAAWTEGHSPAFVAVERSPDDVAAILYTSGTTGKQKGAMLTHGNVVSNMYATCHHVGIRPDDVLLLVLPLFHCFGQNFIMNACVCAGATLDLHRRFELEPVRAHIKEHGVTMVFAVPTIYIYMMNAGVTAQDLASVRYYFSAAATMPVEVAKQWRERYGLPIHEGYGLTETAPFAAYNHDVRYKAGSIGTPIENVEMKVVDEHGCQVPPGTWGEIVIKGPCVMRGYYNKEEETRQAIKDGWFHTGDIGTTDTEGYFYIVDRVKDMINSAGFKVWPREVEEVLYMHPAVKEAVVIGVPDPVKGEAVKAYIISHPGHAATAAELVQHCRDRIASYKVPREIEFVQAVPKSPTGKILKRVLREQSKT